MEIIPAIDIIDGKCVRLTKGDYLTKKIYNSDPIQVAKYFEDCGVSRVHIVDLDGAKLGKIVNYKLIESISRNTDLIIDLGGGLKSNKDIEIAFNSGAKMITAGSLAVSKPILVKEWISKYGADKIILGADVNNGLISINAWQENTNIQIVDYIDTYQSHGIDKVICTDISRDGMMKGPSIELYKILLAKYPNINIIASGGVSSIQDIQNLINIGIDSVIIGKAIYESKIDLRILLNNKSRC